MLWLKPFIRRIWRYFLLPLLIVALAWVIYFKLYGNFHQVDRELYRSAQLYRFNMPYYLQHHHIRSVINLRGSSQKQWYKDELRICKENNVTHYDFGIPDRERISLPKMQKLITLMQNAPKPLLVHCKAGADRTSLASALYLYAVKHRPDAQKAISILYGHFPWLGSRTKAMDQSFENYTTQEKDQ